MEIFNVNFVEKFNINSCMQMLSFIVPLNIQSEDSLEHLSLIIYHCIQYGVDNEV